MEECIRIDIQRAPESKAESSDDYLHSLSYIVTQNERSFP